MIDCMYMHEVYILTRTTGRVHVGPVCREQSMLMMSCKSRRSRGTRYTAGMLAPQDVVQESFVVSGRYGRLGARFTRRRRWGG